QDPAGARREDEREEQEARPRPPHEPLALDLLAHLATSVGATSAACASSSVRARNSSNVFCSTVPRPYHTTSNVRVSGSMRVAGGLSLRRSSRGCPQFVWPLSKRSRPPRSRRRSTPV